jgi:methionine-rich copper-binding protein CopC
MKICRILLLIVTGLLALTVIPALAHAELLRSDPAAGAVLDHAPAEVFAWFSQPLSTGSRLSVFDSQFQPVDKGQTFIDASDATLMRTQVQPLAPGRYTVNWKANSVDGHESSGSYDFIVQEAPTNTPLIIGAVALGIVIIGLIVSMILSNRKRSS